MKNKSLISQIATVGALVLLPVMRMSAAVSPMATTAIKLGAAILLANFLLTTILSFFVLKKINKAWWTPSIVAVTMLSYMVGGSLLIAFFAAAATSYIMLLLGSTLIPFLIQAVVWYVAFGRRNSRTALLLTGISAIYPITLLLVQIFYWITGIGY